MRSKQIEIDMNDVVMIKAEGTNSQRTNIFNSTSNGHDVAMMMMYRVH